MFTTWTRCQRSVRPVYTVRGKGDLDERRAAVFKQHWDAAFGESELFYAHSKEGKFRLEQVQASGMTPQATVRRKSLYL